MKVVFRCPPELQGLIPEPVAARRGLPDWLKDMSSHVLSDELGLDIETVKQCPPFVDAMSGGFLMPLAADIRVEGGRLSWQWDLPASPTIAYPRAPVSFHLPDQLRGSPLFEGDCFAVSTVDKDTPTQVGRARVHQLLDRRSPSGHRTPVHPPRQPSRPAVPHRDRPGAR